MKIENTDFFLCLNCGANSSAQSASKWECSHCGMTYPVIENIPILVKEWTKHEEEIEKARAVNPNWYLAEQLPEETSPWRHHIKKRRLYIEQVLRNYLRLHDKQKADNLLDLGCGDGNNLHYLQHYTHTIYGSDYNLVRLVRARTRFDSATIFLADILDYPARDDFFEVIFLNHVLEHIPDDESALKKIYRILRPGGLLVLGVPNEGVWWWQLAYRLQPESLLSTDHIHFYTAPTVSKVLQKSGFRVREIKHLGWGPPHWEWDMRVRKYKFVDDAFELIGKTILPHQASSLYLLATKDL